MKIIYFHQYFNTPEMNGSTRSFELAKRLVLKGHKVDILTSDRNNKSKKQWTVTFEEGVKVHWYPVPYSNHMNFHNRIKAFIYFAWHSFFKAYSIKSDIIYVSSTPLTLVLPAMCVSIIKRIPMILEVRDLWPKIPMALKILKNPILCYLSIFLEKVSYHYARSIITLSPDMKRDIIKDSKISSYKIAVIPNSSDNKNFKKNINFSKKFVEKFPLLSNSPVLLYAGTFGKVNNLNYAIKLAKALKKIKSNIKILLIGDGIEKKKLILYSKKNKVYGKNIFFENPVSKKKIQLFFMQSTMCANFVINIKETWANSANKFFDSLAAGKPIFLNHGGWMQDIVQKKKCGYCGYGKPILSVAKELNILMNNKEWLKKSGKISKKIAKTYFDRDQHAQQLENILLQSKKNKIKTIAKIAPGVY
jgi:glycosyltransferase involved in cell wall biosynthesis